MRVKFTGNLPNSLFLIALLILLTGNIQGSSNIQSQIEQNIAAAKKAEQQGNKTEQAKYYTKLGYLYWQIDATLEATNFFTKSVTVNNELGNKNAVRTLYNNLGLIHSEREEYQKAIDYFEKSLTLNLKQSKKEAATSDYINIALCFQSLGYYSESNNRAEQALEKALEQNNLGQAKTCYGILGENYEKLGNAKTSSEYYEKFATLTKHLQKEEMQAMATKTKEFETQVITKDQELRSTKSNLDQQMELNREMQLENELLNQKNQLREAENARLEAEQLELEAREKTRRTRFIGLLAVLILFVCIIGLVYWQLAQKKKANTKLQEQNTEIELQKLEIEKQRDLAKKQAKRITDSIQYAQRIQHAVLPPEEAFANSFEDYFILYKPKDIVSGDFYWTTQKDHVMILAIADCTGHGVPGAFMSMLGVAYLNEIVNKIVVNKHISTLNSDEILNELREMIITSLRQTGNPNEPKDGMDIALCVLDFENKKLQFSGANNPLFLIRNNELIKYTADKMPVSYHQKRSTPFTRHEIEWQPDDKIYLFSDGYVDQFGGDKKLKFMVKRFRELLLKINTFPMAEQKSIIEKTMSDWKGDLPQVDDILVFGLSMANKVTVKKAKIKANWSDKTILIAEDTDVNYFLLTAVLKETQASLVRVKDGKEAVDFVKNNEVDLILMDINMPNMNGYEATRIIKELRNDIPIVVQTAMHIDDDSDEAFKSGADDFISKPIDLKTFMTKMEHFLS